MVCNSYCSAQWYGVQIPYGYVRTFYHWTKSVSGGEHYVHKYLIALVYLPYFLQHEWLFQLNGNVTYYINRKGIASLKLGLNSVGSVGHVNNPICWAIIPEKTEGKTTCRDTWRTVQEAANFASNTFRCCSMHGVCPTCSMVMVHDLSTSLS